MSTDLVVAELVPTLPALPELPKVRISDLYEAVLAESKKATTRRAREQDLDALADFLGTTSPAAACELLISSGPGSANAVAMAWQRVMGEAKLSSSTINRRISTLRLVVRLARLFQLVTWTVEVKNLKTESYRDTTGPGRTGWLRLLELANRKTRIARCSTKGWRDLCILRLLHDHGLRRFEVAGLDLDDWDPQTCKLQILGKGRTQEEFISVNNQTAVALSKWIELRGADPGPLFTRVDRAAPKEGLTRLDDDGIYLLVVELGREAGLTKRTRPHGLRHQGVTRVLELSNGNLDMAQKFARHLDPKTTMKYNDARKDSAGEAAKLLGNDA